MKDKNLLFFKISYVLSLLLLCACESYNEDNVYRFFEAVSEGDIQEIKNLNYNGLYSDAVDYEGNNALHYLLKSYYRLKEEKVFPVVKILIEMNVNPDKKNNAGLAPLHVATVHDWGPVVSLLITEGADINLSDKEGNSPIILAIENLKIKSFKALLKLKPNLDIANSEGKRAKQIALDQLNKAKKKLTILKKPLEKLPSDEYSLGMESILRQKELKANFFGPNVPLGEYELFRIKKQQKEIEAAKIKIKGFEEILADLNPL